jgi:CHAT domain-containing protein/tetratricopeptide (TPR) repeat protein
MAALGAVTILLWSAAAGADGPSPPSPEDIRSLVDQGRYAEAEEAGRRFLAAREARSGSESAETAEALDLVLSALLPGGKSGDPETRLLAERAVAIKEKNFGPDHLEAAISLRNLAILHSESGDYPEALRLFERVLSIREKLLGPQHPEVARSLRNVARTRQELGDYAVARPLLERAIAIVETTLGPEHPGAASPLFQLAWLLFLEGDFAASERLFERALVIQEKALGPDHPLVATTLSGLGSAAWRTGDFERARSLLERSNAIREKSLGPAHPDLALSLSNFANVLRLSGEFEGARARLERALAIQEKVRGPGHPEVAIVLGDLAVLLSDMGDRQGALALLERMLTIRETALGPAHPRVAEVLADMGNLLMEMGEDERARARFERGLGILEKGADPAHPVLAEILVRKALLQAKAGRSAEALEAGLRGEEISREHLRLNLLTLPDRLALGYAAMRDPALDLVLSIHPEAPATATARRTWQALLRSRAMVLDEMASRHRLPEGTGDPETGRLAANLASARSRLANLTLRGPRAEPIEDFARLLSDARRDKERLERLLAGKSSAFRREQARSRAGLQEVADALPPGFALLAYARYSKIETEAGAGAHQGRARGTGRVPIRDFGLPVAAVPEYAAFVLRQGDAEPLRVSLGPAGLIDDAVLRWQESVSSTPPAVAAAARAAESGYRGTGSRLRRLVWDPVAVHLRDARQVLVVPDGPLHLLNFAALPAARGRYLVQTGPPIHYLSTERDVTGAHGESTAGKGWLVLGGPDFDRTSRPAPAPPRPAYRGPTAACEAFRSRRWESLPEAGAEVEAIRIQWKTQAPRDQVAGPEDFLALTGTQASEEAFKRLAPGRRVLHVATHGFFVNDPCPSAPRETPKLPELPVRRGELPSSPAGDSPLLLSGLVLAGANERGPRNEDKDSEDGVLTSEEIASLDLSGVEWVVLSACGTGLGKVQSGEGVLGLRRAFQVAGANTLIMSLWRVKDDSALQWMRNLYGHRLSGASTAQAVRRASLDMLDERRRAGLDTHPFWWGAFVAAGDWR